MDVYIPQRRVGFAFVGAVILLGVSAASATIYRVDPNSALGGDGSTWLLALDSIQAALDNPQITQGDEIWVASNTYVPTARIVSSDPRTATFLIDSSLDGVAIYGGFLGLAPGGGETLLSQRDPEANVTILSADVNGDDGPALFQDYGDNLYVVVAANGVSQATLIDGFTIYGANNDNSTAGFIFEGGGMSCFEASPRVARCKFVRNQSSRGGGFYAFQDSDANLVSCSLLGNRAFGSDGGGALVNKGARVTFTNCLWVGNLANQFGGGLMATAREGEVRLFNCTVVGNIAGLGGVLGPGGGIHFDDNQGEDPDFSEVRNTIVWGNSPTQIILGATQTFPPSVSYCDVQGGVPSLIDGGNNITSNPSFVDQPNPGPDGTWGTSDDDFGDTHLYTGSPCINTGFNALLPPDAGDLDSDGSAAEQLSRDLDILRRVKAYIVDRGAYEFGCMEDLNGDCAIDGLDLALLLGDWTGGSTYTPCPPNRSSDFNEDCKVDGSDLAVLLAAWGGCDCPGGIGGGGGGESAMGLGGGESDGPSAEIIAVVQWLTGTLSGAELAQLIVDVSDAMYDFAGMPAGDAMAELLTLLGGA